MREDPIVFEDWRIGTSDFSYPKIMLRLDLFLSTIYIGIQFALGLGLQNATLVFLWMFTFLITIVIEGILEQKTRTLSNRFAFIMLLLFLYAFVTPDRIARNFSFIIFDFILGTILMMKMVILYLIRTELLFNEEILIPKNQMAEDLLIEQILRLQDTEYELVTKEKFKIISKLNLLRAVRLDP